MEFKSKTNEWIEEVDSALDQLLIAEDVPPQVIHHAMRYSMFAGGKRLRPILCLATAEMFNGDKTKVMPVACALEMIHTYSLIHDDLPDLDNDDFRRGKPTNHKVYGNAMAILAGDALLTHAFEILSKEALADADAANNKQRLQANYEIANAVSSRGMIGGQVVDIISEDNPVKEPSVLRYIHTHKTGDLIKTSVRSGALLSGASKEELENITIYAEKIGMAFQITDDILDIEGDQQELGKDIGSDEKNQKLTFPSIYGLEKSKRMARNAITDAITFLEKTGRESAYLKELAMYILTRKK